MPPTLPATVLNSNELIISLLSPETLMSTSDHFFVLLPTFITKLYAMNCLVGFKKWPLYWPQGSGTLRQQLLMMHGIARYSMALHCIA